MNPLQTLQDFIVRFVTIDKNMESLEGASDALRQSNLALRDKIQDVELRVVALENAAAKMSDLQSLETRLTKLETEQAATLREIRAATAELVAERKGLAADAREIIAQIQTNPPQLPPTTDN